MKPLAKIITATALTLLLCAPVPQALAGGFEVAQQSALSAGSANASTARSDAAGAAWYNPSALTDGGGMRLAVGATLAMSVNQAEALESAPDSPWNAQTSNGVSPLPHLYFSWAHASWVAGVSANVPFGSSVRWPADWSQRFDIVRSKVQVYRVTPFFGYRVGPVAIAVGPHFDIAQMELKRATDHIDIEGSSHLLMSGWGAGFEASAYYEVNEQLSFGVSYKSRTWGIRLNGDANFEVPDEFGGDYPDQGVAANWILPDRIALGVSGGFGSGISRFRLLGDISFTLWSVYDTLTLEFADDATDDRDVKYHWRDSMAIRLGAEWTPLDMLTARIGFYWDGVYGAPPPEAHLSASSPDSTRIAGTVGATVRLGKWFAVDAFYEYLHLLSREAASDDTPMARYQGHANIFGLGLRVSFSKASS